MRLALRCACLWGAGLLLGACAPTNVVLRSNHYRVVVPSDWRVAVQSAGPQEPTVLHVPTAVRAGKSDPLELRLYAWVAPEGGGDPLTEAVKLLAGRDEDALRAAARADEDRCGARTRDFWLLGKPQRAAQLRMRNNDHLIVIAATASGSLVAAVGLVPDGPPFCDNLVAMETAIGSLGSALVASADLVRVPDQPVPLANGFRGPIVALPPPDLNPGP